MEIILRLIRFLALIKCRRTYFNEKIYNILMLVLLFMLVSCNLADVGLNGEYFFRKK